jgi:hypothetical protein
MKFIYLKGPWKEFYGYVFYNGQPTEVTDGATLERIQKEPDFQQVKESEDGEEAQAPDQASGILKGKECSKCHQLIAKGWYMHQKWCRVIN